jgi:preprotein translocase subunit SecG
MSINYQIIQTIISVLIIVFVLLQSQSGGTNSAFSGGGETYHTRRGVEKIIFYLTIGLTILFAANSIMLII